MTENHTKSTKVLIPRDQRYNYIYLYIVAKKYIEIYKILMITVCGILISWINILNRHNVLLRVKFNIFIIFLMNFWHPSFIAWPNHGLINRIFYSLKTVKRARLTFNTYVIMIKIINIHVYFWNVCINEKVCTIIINDINYFSSKLRR